MAAPIYCATVLIVVVAFVAIHCSLFCLYVFVTVT